MLTICRALITLAGAIVPAGFRDDWIREWRAELYYESQRLAAESPSLAHRFGLLTRCAGALVHALWLRKEEWSVTAMFGDARYALRNLRQHPAFALTTILTLALGIGATTAVFSIVYGVLLRPLPYRDPDRLVMVWESNPLRNWTHETMAPANMLDVIARSRSFDSVAYYLGFQGKGPGLGDVTLSGNGEPERARAMSVSSQFFDVLGVGAAQGRTFLHDENQRGRTNVVVLSHGLWLRRFGGDPSIVGKRIDLNGGSALVAGVMPADFHIPGGAADIWLPMLHDEARFRQQRRPHYLRVVARLKDGVTIERANDDVRRIMAELEREYPQTNTQMSAGLTPLHAWFVGDVRRAMFGLFGAVALVLLVACTNVASLLLARGAARQREIAIRVALGAGRVRLVRQLLTESLVLASAGALVGLVFARWALSFVRAFGPEDVPRLDRISIDGTVLLFVMVMTCITALLFGAVPAWQACATRAGETLKESARSASTRTTLARRALIVAEVALSVMLLVGAGLLTRSFAQLRGVDPGMNTSRAVSFKISLPGRAYSTDERVIGFYRSLLERLRAMPGVEAAGATNRLTLEGRNWTGDLFVEARPDVWGRELRHKSVTDGYFTAAGIRMIAGRDVTFADDMSSPRVAVVNETLVRQYLAGLDPVGQRIAFDRPGPTTAWTTIVGVVADERQDALDAEPKPEVYEPFTQDSSNGMSIVVRTASAPEGQIAAMRREVAALDPNLALYDVRTLADVVERSLAEERFAMSSLAGFSAVALVLAMVGLYGVVALGVNERRREIGVRLALGAPRRAVLRMVVADGTRLVALGLAIGVALAFAFGRTLTTFLFQVRPSDPIVLTAVITLLAVAGVLASYIPARRASLVDPAVSLRSE